MLDFFYSVNYRQYTLYNRLAYVTLRLNRLHIRISLCSSNTLCAEC